MNLFCASCNAPHDLDMAPDEGTCLICGGPLVEDLSEREAVQGGLGKAVVTAVNDGLAAVAVARGKVNRGQN
jgi:hypothetical protein